MPAQFLADEKRCASGVCGHVPATEPIRGGMPVQVFNAAEVDQAHRAAQPGGQALAEPGPTEGGVASAAQLIGTVRMAQLVHFVPFGAIIKKMERGAFMALVPGRIERHQ